MNNRGPSFSSYDNSLSGVVLTWGPTLQVQMPMVAPSYSLGNPSDLLGISGITMDSILNPSSLNVSLIRMDRSTPKQKESGLYSINGMQKNIIKSVFQFVFDDIATLSPINSEAALRLITKKDFSFEDNKVKNRCEDKWPSVEMARQIFFDSHPEKKLNLPQYNGEREKVTKEAVRNYIRELIQEENDKAMKKMNESARRLQFWYRRTRDENKALAEIKDKENSPLAKSIKKRRG